MTSGYCALVIAFVVTSIESILGVDGIPPRGRLLLPMFIATLAVAWLGYQIRAGTRPRHDQ